MNTVKYPCASLSKPLALAMGLTPKFLHPDCIVPDTDSGVHIPGSHPNLAAHPGILHILMKFLSFIFSCENGGNHSTNLVGFLWSGGVLMHAVAHVNYPRAVVLKVLVLGLAHPCYLWNCEKCKSSGPALDYLFNGSSGGMSSNLLLRFPPSSSETCSSSRTTALRVTLVVRMSWGQCQFQNIFVYVLHKLAKCLKNLIFSASKLYLPGYPGTLKRHKSSLSDRVFCGVNCQYGNY